ncbi:hypothetical protein BV898_00365 [Hypsibius exemplaris]|uniref:Intradiol ring-cleavage dioxygenases domain-containing protein n=1 Tax=Hypsibius exemplaris TaxID=2072580 RepID=A0A1W0XFK5_HYPEX|nr:hypothetical protein BV898_00365 [Hypsibius exemplaris]
MGKPVNLVAVQFFVGVTNTYGHPGTSDDHSTETAATRESFMEKSLMSFGHCSDTRESRNLQKREAERREEIASRLRLRFDSKIARDATSALNTNHHSNKSRLTSATKDELFSSSAISCVLFPEVEVGPYYVDGELIRSDIHENQAGVSLFLDIQVVDINTCKPIPNTYVDIWSCNSTGVYAGVVGIGNGNSKDASNINATFLRGLQPTDAQGVLQFHTIFPGHYSGRTTHIHTVTHLGGSVLANGTYQGGTVQHDRVFLQEAAGQVDPVFQYVLLGSKVEDGILAWITLGVDAKASQVSSSFSSASTWTANGGVANANTGGGFGGPGGMPPGGGYNSGGPPAGGGPPMGAPPGYVNKTIRRGLQPTSTDGMVQIITKFPDHYMGRVTHIHLLTHLNGTVFSNRTFSGGAIQHVGQLFFDDDLVTAANDFPPNC